MLCNLLKDVYINEVHKSLDDEEFIYSVELKYFLLDMINSCKIKFNTKSEVLYYIKNGEDLFRLEISCKILSCSYRKVYQCFADKYNFDYFDFIYVMNKLISGLNPFNNDIIGITTFSIYDKRYF